MPGNVAVNGIRRMDDVLRDLVDKLGRVERDVRKLKGQVGDFMYDPNAEGRQEMPKIHIFPVEITAVLSPDAEHDYTRYECKRVVYTALDTVEDDEDDETVTARGLNDETYDFGKRVFCHYVGWDATEMLPIYRLSASGRGNVKINCRISSLGVGGMYNVEEIEVINQDTDPNSWPNIAAKLDGLEALAVNLAEYQSQDHHLEVGDLIELRTWMDTGGTLRYYFNQGPGFGTEAPSP